jgi:tetratricopeptide (TPR) repeat protein
MNLTPMAPKYYIETDISQWMQSVEEHGTVLCTTPSGFGKTTLIARMIQKFKSSGIYSNPRYIEASDSEDLINSLKDLCRSDKTKSDELIKDLIHWLNSRQTILFLDINNNESHKFLSTLISFANTYLDQGKLFIATSFPGLCLLPSQPDSAPVLMRLLNPEQQYQLLGTLLKQQKQQIPLCLNIDLVDSLCWGIPYLVESLSQTVIKELELTNTPGVDSLKYSFYENISDWCTKQLGYLDTVFDTKHKTFLAILDGIYSISHIQKLDQNSKRFTLSHLKPWMRKSLGYYVIPEFLQHYFKSTLAPNILENARAEFISNCEEETNPLEETFFQLGRFAECGIYSFERLADLTLKHRLRILLINVNKNKWNFFINEILQNIPEPAQLNYFQWELEYQSKLISNPPKHNYSGHEFCKSRINAKILCSQGKHESAYKENLNNLKLAHSSLDKLECYINAINSLAHLRDTKQSSLLLEKAKKIKHNDQVVHGLLYYLTGYIYTIETQYQKAYPHYEKALKLFEQERANHLYALTQKAILEQDFSNFEIAKVKERLDRLNEFALQTEIYMDNSTILRLKTKVAMHENNHAEASCLAHQLIHTEIPNNMFIAYGTLAKISLQEGQISEAEYHLNNAKELAQKSQTKGILNPCISIECLLEIVRGETSRTKDKLIQLTKLDLSRSKVFKIVAFWLISNLSEQQAEIVEYKTLYHNCFEQLPDEGKEAVRHQIEWLSPYIKTKPTIKVYLNKSHTSVIQSDLDIIRKNKSKYSLFLDFDAKEFLYKSSSVGLGRKKILISLLAFLVENPNQILDNKVIFETVWKSNFDPETDVYTVRTTINRLRKILHTNQYEPLKTIEGKISSYKFELSSEDCIIFAR